ncbi:hypothetical protein Hamer_G023603 [Homarus americanus]|uniref:Uncharacterized protein n=1 Tax=Homarus americanus TaxID=6706 RepID=A0A8J5JXJ2_HOMAM|nr:hypothetical protein Hamer_G023603 [Homarus americanus]
MALVTSTRLSCVNLMEVLALLLYDPVTVRNMVNNGATEQRNNRTTEQRNNRTTEQQNNETAEQRNKT